MLVKFKTQTVGAFSIPSVEHSCSLVMSQKDHLSRWAKTPLVFRWTAWLCRGQTPSVQVRHKPENQLWRLRILRFSQHYTPQLTEKTFLLHETTVMWSNNAWPSVNAYFICSEILYLTEMGQCKQKRILQPDQQGNKGTEEAIFHSDQAAPLILHMGMQICNGQGFTQPDRTGGANLLLIRSPVLDATIVPFLGLTGAHRSSAGSVNVSSSPAHRRHNNSQSCKASQQSIKSMRWEPQRARVPSII